MHSPRVHGLVAIAAAAAFAMASAAEPAARIGQETLSVAEVDAATGGKAEQLLQRLHQLAVKTLDGSIDERVLEGLNAAAVAPEPVREADVDAFRRERAEDFEGPLAPGGSARDPAVQRAAIRHFLESEAAERARERTLAARRAGRRIERLLPEAAQLAVPLAADQVVARVDGAPILAVELETRAALRLYRLRGELARERIRRASGLVEDRLLAREARQRGTSVEAMIEAETRPPDEQAVRAYQERERAAGRPVPKAERARPYLAFRAGHEARERLLDAARARTPVVFALAEPTPPRLPVETAGAPSLGPPDGARLVVFANYACRDCRSVHAEIDRLLAASRDVRVIFRDFIPSYDPAAREAAVAARCADRQGRFAAMRRALLAAPRPEFGSGLDLDALAAAAGVDAAALRACMDAEVERATDADTKRARDLGFDVAPAFVAEGVPLSGAQSAAGLARALREGLGD